MINYFLQQQAQDIKAYYEENGYVVIKDAISDSELETFYKSYERLKSSKGYYFRSQDTNRAEQLKVNSEGFIEHSILNPNRIVLQNNFRKAAEKIIYANTVSNLLSLLSGQPKHVVWQTMFFDKSTGTIAHQDHYYLDSNPPGHLIAAWFALEDIQEDAGTFFVVPKSHNGPLIKRQSLEEGFADHDDYVVKIKNLISEQNYEFKPMPLQKGSILLWHPFLLHGAFPNQNPHHSRKSFTAHYLPHAYSPLGISSVAPTVSTANPNVLVWKKSALEQAKSYINYVRYWAEVNFRSENTRPKMEMRVSKY